MSRNVKDLHPKLQQKVEELLELCRKNGITIGISECLRTKAEQDALYAKGRTAPGPIVTNAKGSSYSSMHQWGVAFDFYLMMDVDGDGNIKDDNYNNSSRLFNKVGALGKSIGLEWGGDWKSIVDMPHLQLSDWGSTAKKLKEKYKTPEAFFKTWEDIPEVNKSASELQEEKNWKALRAAGITPAGAAGVFGNLHKESLLRSNNLQDSGNAKLKMTDDQYTSAVDNGTYKNFVTDSIGYGYAQWTSSGRKKALLEVAKQKKVSIANPDMQIEFLLYELKNNYKSVFKVLTSTNSIAEASNVMLHKFEQPKDQGKAEEDLRISYSKKYYNKYATLSPDGTTNNKPAGTIVDIGNCVATTTAKSGLVLRLTPTKSASKVTSIPYNSTVVVLDTSCGTADGLEWAKVKYDGHTGYVATKYLKDMKTVTSSTEDVKDYNKNEVQAAESKNVSYKGTYKTTVNLNLRSGAGTGNNVIITIPKGSEIHNYGYYTKHGKDVWLLVQYGKYTGYVHSRYVKK